MRTLLRNQFAVPVLLTLLTVTLLIAPATAQIDGLHAGRIAPRGMPASVTSFGFGGHPGFHGVPASVTSQGFGASNNFRGFSGHVTSFGFGARNGFHQRPFEHGRRRIHRPFVVYSPYYGGYASPYVYPYYLNDEDYSDSAAYQAPASDYRDDDSRDNARDEDDRQVLDQDYRAGLNRPREQSAERDRKSVV